MNGAAIMATAINAAVTSERELTEDELNHVSGGKPSAAPKQDAFPTETIKLSYGAIVWAYGN
jgi:bacteriocin-like protein